MSYAEEFLNDTKDLALAKVPTSLLWRLPGLFLTMRSVFVCSLGPVDKQYGKMFYHHIYCGVVGWLSTLSTHYHGAISSHLKKKKTFWVSIQNNVFHMAPSCCCFTFTNPYFVLTLASNPSITLSFFMHRKCPSHISPSLFFSLPESYCISFCQLLSLIVLSLIFFILTLSLHSNVGREKETNICARSVSLHYHQGLHSVFN